MISFRDLLKQLMTDHKVSQKKLSEATGVRRAAINEFLNQKSLLRSDQLEKLLNYFEKPI
jgi:transcriptional regulator with XRE-family HTH domain